VSYVLVETVASKRAGHPVYFRFWSRIGPVCTSELKEAMRFDTHVAALASRAMTFALTYFETKEIP
jgi:hypothetical protein